MPLVYGDLRRVARAQLRRVRPGDTLNTTGLVHEAYVRLVDQSRASWRDRGHFFAVSAMAMRQIVVDYARRRGRQKRGGDQVIVPFDDALDPAAHEADRLLEIDAALEKLAQLDAEQARKLDADRIEFENLKIDAYSDDDKKIYVELPRSIFNLSTRILTSESRFLIRR